MEAGTRVKVTLTEFGKTFAIRYGKVSKVSKNGQITVILSDDRTVRFTAGGREIGGSQFHPNWSIVKVL